MTATTAAIPTDQPFRFDRSERLWGATGQVKLMNAHVVMLGVTSTGCETLKNLVLPGLGRFTIVDGATVGLNDLGTNFFVASSAEGTSRAEAAVADLSELNPDCRGTAIAQSIAHVLGTDGGAAFFGALSPAADLVIVTSEVTPSEQVALGNALAKTGIPLVATHTNGLVGAVRVQSQDRNVVDAVTDTDLRVVDFRTLDPFPALRAFYDRCNPRLREQPASWLNHLPYPAVIHAALEEWRKANPAEGPKGFPKGGVGVWKAALRPIIEKWTLPRTSVNDGQEVTVQALPDSYGEAIDALGPTLDPRNRNIPEIKALLADPRSDAPNQEFWFLVAGLKLFLAGNDGRMPLAPTIPDVETTTQIYREMTQIFAEQSLRDAQTIHAHVQDQLVKAGRSKDAIRFEVVSHFASHAWDLQSVRFPSFEEQWTMKWAPERFKGGNSPALRWLASLCAAEEVAEHRRKAGGALRRPGHSAAGEDASLPTGADEAELRAVLRGRCPSYDAVFASAQEPGEIVRFGGGEPVFAAAIVGAVSAQECIKLLQELRVPQTFAAVFDGHSGVVETVSLLL